MKKFLIFLGTLLVSIFLFNDNVRAEDNLTEIYHIYSYQKKKEASLSFNKTNNSFIIKDVYGVEHSYSLEEYPYYLCGKSYNANYGYDTHFSCYFSKEVLKVENDYVIVSDTEKAISLDINTYSSFEYEEIKPSHITSNEVYQLIKISWVINYYTEDRAQILNYDLYRDGELLLGKNNDFSKPKINIEKIKENEYTYLTNGHSVILNYEMKINFSNFDTNKYKYLYSYDIENWYEITENNYEFLVNKNCSIYVKILDLNDNYINSATYTITGIKENIIDYSIEDGTEQGKKVIIYYYNFDSTDYFIVDNFQTGKEDKYNSEMTGIITYDNINLDNTYNINAYDKDNNLIKRKVIDIQVEEAKLNKDRYISLNLIKEKKKIIFSFINYKKSDKCYYKISSEEEIEVECGNTKELDITKNGYVEIYIKNDNEIVLKRGVNVNFITNLPIFKFESYYNDSESKQVLKIVIDNLKNGDVVSYSFDKESWFSLETKRINYLDFYSSSEVYFKVERNSEIVSEAYFDLVYKAFENSSTNNDLQKYNGLKGLLNYFKDITKNVTSEPFKIAVDAYNLIKKSKLSLYILIVIMSSIVILFLKSIKR